MPTDTSFAFLADLRSRTFTAYDDDGLPYPESSQEEYLRNLPKEEQVAIHDAYGFGSLECRCKAIPIPCPEHMARGVLVGMAIINGATGDVGEWSDRLLFKLAWPEWKKRTRCDCPTLWEPCEHAKAHAAGSIESPLTPAAKLVLLQLVNAIKDGEPDRAEAQEGTDAATHATKSVPIAQRHAAGYGVQSRADFVSRELPTEQTDRFKRDPENGPNGQPDPGPIQLQIWEEPDDYNSPEYDAVTIEGPEPKMGRCWACKFAVLDGNECPDCKRAREAYVKATAPKKRKAAV